MIKFIKSIKLSNLRNSELLQFIKDVVSRCQRFSLENVSIESVVNNLETNVTLLEKAYNNEQGSDVTELLTELDASRDKSITGIKLFCEANTYQKDSTIAEAADVLLESISRHGHSIAKLNYQAETTVIDSILQDWETESSLKKAIETLTLKSWVTNLNEDNKSFSETYQDRVDDKLANSVDSFSELRVNAINTYKALCDTIFAYSVINKSEEYQKLTDAINIIIADYDSILAKREASRDEQQV